MISCDTNIRASISNTKNELLYPRDKHIWPNPFWLVYFRIFIFILQDQSSATAYRIHCNSTLLTNIYFYHFHDVCPTVLIVTLALWFDAGHGAASRYLVFGPPADRPQDWGDRLYVFVCVCVSLTKFTIMTFTHVILLQTFRPQIDIVDRVSTRVHVQANRLHLSTADDVSKPHTVQCSYIHTWRNRLAPCWQTPGHSEDVLYVRHWEWDKTCSNMIFSVCLSFRFPSPYYILLIWLAFFFHYTIVMRLRSHGYMSEAYEYQLVKASSF